MKKIIVAFDGLNFSQSAMEYAVDLAKKTNAHLVGVFLDDLVYHSYKFSDLISEEGGVSDEKIKKLNEKDEKIRKESIHNFSKACEDADIHFSVHHNRNVAVKDLLHESIYSDLLVMSRNDDFNIYKEEVPSNFMRDILTDVQCPVLVVAEEYTPIQKIIFLYDGEPSSVYAVKMFSYIMSSLQIMPVEVLSVKPQKQSLHIPDNRLMKEFMKRHFPEAKYTVLKGSPEETILTFLQQQNEDTLVVLGAYRRSKISRWFKPSMADHLMSKLKLPLYVAHNK
jgi:nucleotide-binding universal stress UspA family protein